MPSQNEETKTSRRLFSEIVKRLISFWNAEPPNVQNIAKDITAIFIIVSTFYIIVFVSTEIRREYIIFEPFEVPETLSKNGYTGNTIIQKILSRINHIKANSVVNFDSVLINGNYSSSYDIILPGSGGNLRSLVIHLKEKFSAPLYFVNGHIVSDNDKLRMMINMRGKSNIPLNNAEEYIVNEHNSIDEMVNIAALKLYIQINPLAMAGYYYNNEDYKTVLVILGNKQKGSRSDDLAFLLLASSYWNLRQYDLALQNIELALKYNNKKAIKGFIYRIYGDILRKMNRFDDAAAKYQNSISINPKEPYSYYLMGDVLILQDKYKEAAKYLQLGLSLNNEASKDSKKTISDVIQRITMNNISSAHISKKDLNVIIINHINNNLH